MIALALRYDSGPVSMRGIAERQGISLKYLHSLLGALRGAGLVRAVRGRGGGYELARRPEEIDLAELLRVLEGSLVPAPCVEEEGACDRAVGCVAREVWQELGAAIEGLLSRLTLGDLVARIREREPLPPMYYI